MRGSADVPEDLRKRPRPSPLGDPGAPCRKGRGSIFDRLPDHQRRAIRQPSPTADLGDTGSRALGNPCLVVGQPLREPAESSGAMPRTGHSRYGVSPGKLPRKPTATTAKSGRSGGTGRNLTHCITLFKIPVFDPPKNAHRETGNCGPRMGGREQLLETASERAQTPGSLQRL